MIMWLQRSINFNLFARKTYNFQMIGERLRSIDLRLFYELLDATGEKRSRETQKNVFLYHTQVRKKFTSYEQNFTQANNWYSNHKPPKIQKHNRMAKTSIELGKENQKCSHNQNRLLNSKFIDCREETRNRVLLVNKLLKRYQRD